MNRVKGIRKPLNLLILSLVGVTLLTYCASMGRQFQLEGVNQVTIGTTKMDEVRSLLGNPYNEIDVATWGFKRMHFGDEKTTTIWNYIYASGSILGASSKILIVDFDNEGKVTNYSFNSNFGKDKTQTPKETDRKDFDIFLAKKKIISKKTTQAEVLSLLGNNYKEVSINKPGTKVRWTYVYTKQSKDEKVLVPISSVFSSHNVEVNKVYEKNLSIDFNANEIVIDVRGESTFPEDKDKFFTK